MSDVREDLDFLDKVVETFSGSYQVHYLARSQGRVDVLVPASLDWAFDGYSSVGPGGKRGVIQGDGESVAEAIENAAIAVSNAIRARRSKLAGWLADFDEKVAAVGDVGL